MLLSPEVSHSSLSLPLNSETLKLIERAGLITPSQLETAHPKRIEKFLAGRYCAYQSFLKAHAHRPPNIPIRDDGSPDWPLGWVGSITHTESFAMAAIAPSTKLKGLGIDSEILMSEKTFHNISKRILTPNENNLLRPINWSDIEWATFIFSAKESIYKCLRPLCGNFFGFEDAEINMVETKTNTFRFHLTRHIGGEFNQNWQGEGHFQIDNNLIHTATELPK